ncbi:AGAP008101-PA-like protein [Anopheles sinensis]|uniref:AGAP008101-PA-like protein n=1 Tax=Anopheles sinensis TaxID=74873 RepID=A0A084WGW9_ANOSI|nr:AGAP008101-PA-like protein [Anopheles sinensis]
MLNTFLELGILLKLGIVVYRALDYNLPTSEDCHISHELEELIDFMTSEGKLEYVVPCVCAFS